jgi:DNA-binding transcriptional LysR family regulator
MCGFETRAQDPDPPIRVRFDAMHSHTWIETLPQPGLNQYHLLAGPSRAAQTLAAMGWQVDVQLEAWDAASLASLDLVVLNLVSADRPAFRVSEIAALREFVQRGAGLIIITDHTNCYFHNHALEPLFDQLDLISPTRRLANMHPILWGKEAAGS